MAKKRTKKKKTVANFTHEEDKRTNIPTAELESVVQEDVKSPIRVAYERRNRDLDPQLVWRGKDEQDGSDLVVNAPPLYIQEKVHPKVLIDDLLKESRQLEKTRPGTQLDLFSDFNGLPEEARSAEFYQHDANWTNRMILGDSLQVMASLSEREGLRGKVQCIYLDPPYGIKFNSNFQWSTTSRDVKDGKLDHITREPEQVKAFRDTWRDGIHSYLTYLRDRLTVARDLLTESGSIFVQIGDENFHLVKSLLDETFSPSNCCAVIAVSKSGGALGTAGRIPTRFDFLLWYGKNGECTKYRARFERHPDATAAGFTQVKLQNGNQRSLRSFEDGLPDGARLFISQVLTKPGPGRKYDIRFHGKLYSSGSRWWGTPPESLERVIRSGRALATTSSIRYLRYFDDFPYRSQSNLWDGIGGAIDKTYVVQTSPEIVKRCILMTTDPGDLVLDPHMWIGNDGLCR